VSHEQIKTKSELVYAGKLVNKRRIADKEIPTLRGMKEKHGARNDKQKKLQSDKVTGLQ